MPIEQSRITPNLSPFYNYFLVSPSPSSIVSYNPELDESNALFFEVGGLDDPNSDDLIFWRVFLNYQGRFYNAIYRSNRGDGLSPTLREEGISFQINPCLDFKLFQFEGPYRVELIVSDRPFLTADTDETQINQLLASGAKSFRIHWFVDYNRTLCPL